MKKIAVGVEENSKDAQVSDRAGRAAYYLVFDEAGKLLETISNPFARGGGGAGFGVAKMLADKDVRLVIAGKMGENMKEALRSRGLDFKELSGKAKDAAQSNF